MSFERKYNVVDGAGPSPAQLALDKTLELYMLENIPVDSPADVDKRKRALVALAEIFRSWVKHVAVHEHKMPLEQVEEVGGAILVSGSFRLGVHEPGADVDTVCVAPVFCTKSHFFGTLKTRLQQHPQIHNLLGVESAHVPILTFDFEEINIDLSFATLPHRSVNPNLDVLDDKILQGVDASTATSLNGPRVTNMIEKVVVADCASEEQKIQRFEVFLKVLRCVRKWAKRRGLYGNKLGYLGGVNFNILVAMVCQLFPRASVSTLLKHFFNVYTRWNWSMTDKPVQLTNTVVHDDMLFEVWKPEKNRHHLMPIITPAYPAMNSSYNVNVYSLEVMKEEFARGKEICGRVLAQGGQGWAELFEPTDFFVRYSRYIACNIIASGMDEACNAWIGFVASRIRRIPECLGKLPLNHIHLLPIKFPTTISPNSHCYFVGFEIDTVRARERDVELNRAIDEFKSADLGRYQGETPEGCEFHCELYQWSQLPDVVFKDLGGKSQARERRRHIVMQKRRLQKPSAPSADPETMDENGVNGGADSATGPSVEEQPAVVAAAASATSDHTDGKEEENSQARAPKRRRLSETFQVGSVSVFARKDMLGPQSRPALPSLLPFADDPHAPPVLKRMYVSKDGVRSLVPQDEPRIYKRFRSVTFDFLPE